MKRKLIISISLILTYVIFTICLLYVDRMPVGPNNSVVGFSTINKWFHDLTGVNWVLYNITDWGGIPPVALGLFFAIVGLIQLIKRKSLFKVDKNILILGGFYILVFVIYLLFEFMVINRRPVLINGILEASYPSTTTFVSITFLASAFYPIGKYIKSNKYKLLLNVIVWIYMLFLIIGRCVSGVHWLTDIIGSIILGTGLVLGYEAACSIDKLNKNCM